MKKKSSIKEKWKNKTEKGGFFPLSGVALIVFALTAAVFFAAHYVVESYNRDNMLSNWEYMYTEKAGAVPAGELRSCNAWTPILTEREVRRNNIYLTRTIKATESGKVFVAITDFSPMKIRLNGKVVYNNHFDRDDYVGNCYNAVVIPESTHEQQLEVFMKLPFAVRYEAYLNEGGDPSFAPNGAFLLGCGLSALGFAAVLMFGVMSIVKRKPMRSLITAGLVTWLGVIITLHVLPEITYWLNTPMWLKVTLLPVHMTFMGVLVCLNSLFKDHKKSAVAIGFASGVSIFAVSAAMTPLLIKLAAVLMCVLCLLAAAYSVKIASMQLERRTQYATPVFVMCVYYTFSMFVAGLMLYARMRVLYCYTVVVPSVAVVCVLEYIFIADYRFQKKNSELRDQTSRYGATVDNVSLFIRNMLNCTDESRFYETAVDEILDLLLKFREDNEAVRCCAAVKTADGFEEKVNRGVGDCRYDIIERNCLHNGKNCLFAETYFDFVLFNTEDVGAVFHFENVGDGLDLFFVSVLEATYCGLETTYEYITSNGELRDVNVIFEELAENAEIDNGCAVEHLENIYRHSYALCRRMGQSDEEARHIATASKLHDLGKIAVPKYIIHKEGRLSEDERVVVNSHTKFGYTILPAFSDDPLIATAATIARYHHERYDGTGANGLKGEDIPFEARVVTVCDVYDALVSERAYKKAWTKKEAMDYLSDNEEKIFDPVITETFLEQLREED